MTITLNKHLKRCQLLFMGLIFSAITAYGQAEFRSGYIITNSGDTISGRIEYRESLQMNVLCKFQQPDNTVIEYGPNDIQGYRFTNGKFFVSKEADGNRVFMEYLINGQISIYSLRDNEGEHYYLEKEDVRLTEILYEEGIKYKEDVAYKYASTKHLGLLKMYMQDAPDIQKQIRKVQVPQHNNLIKLAEAYHHAVCDDKACIIYGANMRRYPFIQKCLEA